MSEDTPKTYIDLGDGRGQIDAALAPKNDPERKFRNAWMHDGKKSIVIDMDKARAIQLDAIRAERKPLLDQLDVAYQRADEDGDQVAKKTVATKKKALRDLTKDQRIAKAKSPEELGALTLDALLVA